AVGQCSLPPPLRPEAGEPSPALTPCSLSDTLILDRTLCRLVTLAAPAMFARLPGHLRALTAVPFLVLAVAGCGKSRVEASGGEKRTRALGMMYLRYSTNNIGRKQSVEQFKQFIKKVPANELEPYGIQPADLDPLFVSPRDGQPYVIRFGAPPAPPSPLAPATVVIYEATGAGGKRLTFDAVGGVADLDEEAFRQRVPDAK